MNDDEVQKQLDHMVKFIYREAEEKATEIREKAKQECDIEKGKIVVEEKMKITREFERKEKQIETKIKIAYSNELNQSRLQVLKARDEGIQKLLSESHARLAAITKDANSYKKLLQDLIVQGLIKLQEPKVSIVCRQQDKKVIQDVLKAAIQEYTQKSGKQVEVDIDNTIHLPPGPDQVKAEESCSGGVLLSSNGGKIICSNTLDARLAMSFEQQLPAVREAIFGVSTTRKHRD